MAGPGGGPSRRSHTKSRKGCRTCKRRHIRCDETFPQCRNCTKHQVRCDYMNFATIPKAPHFATSGRSSLPIDTANVHSVNVSPVTLDSVNGTMYHGSRGGPNTAPHTRTHPSYFLGNITQSPAVTLNTVAGTPYLHSNSMNVNPIPLTSLSNCSTPSRLSSSTCSLPSSASAPSPVSMPMYSGSDSLCHSSRVFPGNNVHVSTLASPVKVPQTLSNTDSPASVFGHLPGQTPYSSRPLNTPPYLDSSFHDPHDNAALANLPLWTPQIESIIDQWQHKGQFPFTDLLELPCTVNWFTFSRTDLRLLYHVCSIASELRHSHTANVSVWINMLPKILSCAMVHPYVLHALLAFSASHLAWIAQSSETHTLAVHFAGQAKRAWTSSVDLIVFSASANSQDPSMQPSSSVVASTFMKSTADAIVAAALLLLWQSNEVNDWSYYVRNVQRVISIMPGYWRTTSSFKAEIALFGVAQFSSISFGRENGMDEIQYTLDALDRFFGYLTASTSVLSKLEGRNIDGGVSESMNRGYGESGLQIGVDASTSFPGRGDREFMNINSARSLRCNQSYAYEHRWVEQLRNFVEQLRDQSNVDSSNSLAKRQYQSVYCLLKWLIWVPISLLFLRKTHVSSHLSQSGPIHSPSTYSNLSEAAYPSPQSTRAGLKHPLPGSGYQYSQGLYDQAFMQLAVPAYFYATAIALSPVFPSTHGAGQVCGQMAVEPLKVIIQAFDSLTRSVTGEQSGPLSGNDAATTSCGVACHSSLMNFPREMLNFMISRNSVPEGYFGSYGNPLFNSELPLPTRTDVSGAGSTGETGEVEGQNYLSFLTMNSVDGNDTNLPFEHFSEPMIPTVNRQNLEGGSKDHNQYSTRGMTSQDSLRFQNELGQSCQSYTYGDGSTTRSTTAVCESNSAIRNSFLLDEGKSTRFAGMDGVSVPVASGVVMNDGVASQFNVDEGCRNLGATVQTLPYTAYTTPDSQVQSQAQTQVHSGEDGLSFLLNSGDSGRCMEGVGDRGNVELGLALEYGVERQGPVVTAGSGTCGHKVGNEAGNSNFNVNDGLNMGPRSGVATMYDSVRSRRGSWQRGPVHAVNASVNLSAACSLSQSNQANVLLDAESTLAIPRRVSPTTGFGGHGLLIGHGSGDGSGHTTSSPSPLLSSSSCSSSTCSSASSASSMLSPWSMPMPGSTPVSTTFAPQQHAGTALSASPLKHELSV